MGSESLAVTAIGVFLLFLVAPGVVLYFGLKALDGRPRAEKEPKAEQPAPEAEQPAPPTEANPGELFMRDAGREFALGARHVVGVHMHAPQAPELLVMTDIGGVLRSYLGDRAVIGLKEGYWYGVTDRPPMSVRALNQAIGKQASAHGGGDGLAVFVDHQFGMAGERFAGVVERTARELRRKSRATRASTVPSQGRNGGREVLSSRTAAGLRRRECEG